MGNGEGQSASSDASILARDRFCRYRAWRARGSSSLAWFGNMSGKHASRRLARCPSLGDSGLCWVIRAFWVGRISRAGDGEPDHTCRTGAWLWTNRKGCRGSSGLVGARRRLLHDLILGGWTWQHRRRGLGRGNTGEEVGHVAAVKRAYKVVVLPTVGEHRPRGGWDGRSEERSCQLPRCHPIPSHSTCLDPERAYKAVCPTLPPSRGSRAHSASISRKYLFNCTPAAVPSTIGGILPAACVRPGRFPGTQ